MGSTLPISPQSSGAQGIKHFLGRMNSATQQGLLGGMSQCPKPKAGGINRGLGEMNPCPKPQGGLVTLSQGIGWFCLSIYLSIHPSIQESICLCICLPIYLSNYPSIYRLSIYPCINLSMDVWSFKFRSEGGSIASAHQRASLPTSLNSLRQIDRCSPPRGLG